MQLTPESTKPHRFGFARQLPTKATAFILAAFLLIPPIGPRSLGAEAKASNAPNIVLILADDLGRADCGFMGGKVIKTPNLDRLASEGAVFDSFYVQPVCSPTRAALMTGRYPMRHGLQVGVVRPWAQYGLPLDERTLPSALKETGYETAITGKWHLGHFQRAYLPTQRGFDHQYGHYNGALDYFTHIRDGGFDWHRDDKVCRDEGYTTTLLGEEAARLIRDRDAKKPLFLYVPFNAVHSPYQALEEDLALYPGLSGNRQSYAAMLTAMDRAIGRIVEALKEEGILEKTLILFSSDNGGPSPGRITDNGPLRAGKGTLYEGGVRVVAFARWPGQIPGGSRVSQPMHMVDWYPTLLNLAGASLVQEKPLDGQDMWPAIAQGATRERGPILLNTTPTAGAIRLGSWKLVVRSGAESEPESEQGEAPPEKAARKAASKASRAATVELFDLSTDLAEANNLASGQPEKVAELRRLLDDFAREAVTPRAAPPAAGFQSPSVWGEAD